MNAIRGALRIATNSIGRMFGRAPRPMRQPKTNTSGGKPTRSGGRGPGLFDKLFTGISGFLNFKNEEYTDAGLAGLALALPRGGKLGLVKYLAGAGLLLDDLAESFGGNLFGKNPNQQKELFDAVDEVKQSEQSAQAETSSNVEPTEGLMGGKSMGDDHHDGGVEANTSQANFQNIDEPTPADVSPAGSSEPPAAQVSSPGNMSTPASSVGPTPAPKPEVNILPQTPQTTEVPSEQAATAANIPKVISFNKDNFYPLYSQVNYNVVT
jgi:hypothetical protein